MVGWTKVTELFYNSSYEIHFVLILWFQRNGNDLSNGVVSLSSEDCMNTFVKHENKRMKASCTVSEYSLETLRNVVSLERQEKLKVVVSCFFFFVCHFSMSTYIHHCRLDKLRKSNVESLFMLFTTCEGSAHLYTC
ncbi:hypothetical protein Gasu2_60840 [Galdieria sulphuraria]|nr:hypothetical protein Gasu2_60840 [Galdieria sulphuraria]